ncbi:MAG: pyridoxal-dependent decarboxylase [Cellvibrionales bacterium]|nr:pyridoxal-dependent decarboxylase [Cellvibrionales bacterium]
MTQGIVTNLSDENTTSKTAWLFNHKDASDLVPLIDQAKALIQECLDNSKHPYSGATPKELRHIIDQNNINKELTTNKAFNTIKHLWLDNLIHFNDPLYAAHLNCPIADISIAAELLATTFNTAVESWDQSTSATLIEQQVIDWALRLCQFDESSDGVFTSGGSQSNLMAVMMARDYFCDKRLNHSTKTQGLPSCANHFVIFCSELSHFSIQKSAALCGLGYQSVITVASDKHYRMHPDALSLAIRNAKRAGKIPIAVVATAGTTDFGSIDPLAPIGTIAKMHGLWFHVDAAYGGALLVSESQRHKLNGIESADSVTVDFHKSYFQPVACSAFLLRNESHFTYATYHADYLNPLRHSDDETINLVNKSLQTTRRFDALKLYMTLLVVGQDAIGKAFDSACEVAKNACDIFQSQPLFDVLPKGDLSTVVFRYLPLNYASLSTEILNEGNYQLREQLIAEGKVMIAATKYQGVQLLKCTFLNPDTQIEHIQTIAQAIVKKGDQIFAELTEEEAVA